MQGEAHRNSMLYFNDEDDVLSKRISNRKRLKAKTYDSEFIDNKEQIMLNQVDSATS